MPTSRGLSTTKKRSPLLVCQMTIAFISKVMLFLRLILRTIQAPTFEGGTTSLLITRFSIICK
ncbi:MAG: hypothetical protein AAFY16_13160 [Cyanobacteria bacterium J06642_3]